ncbi:MAG: SCO family protein [Bacteriovoracaceae bacterium]|nr:SCO family protein [Bacteriovoracaceae bacterium]
MQAYIRNNLLIEKIVLNKWFWSCFCLFFFAYPIYRSLNRELPAELPVMSAVPTFQMQDENGKSFGSADLKGKVYIANFHFTNCPSVCPELMKTLQKIQNRLRGVGQAVAIVSFTVDPEHDTSKVLFAKARDLNANPFVWKFLTAPKKEMEALLLNGFKVPMGEMEKQDVNMYDIAHTVKLVLVDIQGNIRGYYDTDRVNVDKLMIDIGLLINRDKLNYK